jgi:hypothetical protein
VSAFALVNANSWVHGYDFTGDTNKITVATKLDELETTTFGNAGYKTRVAGLRDVTVQEDGFWQSASAAAVDPQAFPDLAVADRVCTFSPDGAAGSVAYAAQLGKFEYDLFGPVGQLAPFTLQMAGTSPQGVVRGLVAAGKQSASGTGALGSAVNLGAPTAGQYVYCAFHIFSAGTTITVQIQSDTASNFPSPTTQATLTGLTAVGGTWMPRVAGPFSGETWWRLNVSAITGTFSVAGMIAVQ